MKKTQKEALLERIAPTLGVHTHPDRWPFKGEDLKDEVLRGKVARIEMREERARQGLPLARLTPLMTCYACGDEVGPKKKGKRDPAKGVALYGEWVLLHRRCSLDEASA